MSIRAIPQGEYDARRTHWEAVGARRCMFRGVALGLLVIGVLLGLGRVSEASTPKAQIQRTVDHFASRHIRHLSIDCRRNVCAAYGDGLMAVVVLVKGQWVVRSGVA